MIDILAIAEQAADSACNEADEDFIPEIIALWEQQAITDKTIALLMHDPFLTMAMAGKAGISALQVVLGWYWQMGRLYGNQEFIDKSLEGMEK